MRASSLLPWAGACGLGLLATQSFAWQHLEPGGAATDVLIDQSDDVISAGFSLQPVPAFVVQKHSGGSGAPLWTYVLAADPEPWRQAILARGTGGSVFAASRYGSGPYLSHVARLDGHDGSEIWRLALPGIGVYAIASDPAGDLVVV